MWEKVTFHRLRCAGDGCHHASEPRQTMVAALTYALSGMLWRQMPDDYYVCPDCSETYRVRSVGVHKPSCFSGSCSGCAEVNDEP